MDSKQKQRLIAELNEEQKKGIRNRPWTEDEVSILKMFYGKVPSTVIAKKLGRTASSLNAAMGRYVR